MDRLGNRVYEDTLIQAADMGDTDLIAKIKIIKDVTSPEPHHMIDDKDTGITSRCQSNE